ncbi:BamA/TamA family outer membrane protein [Flaviaesturariibacter flavus]|nr:BamA/TamA family outer membrane protein [Flaviaesturariibacter flavus]
MTQSSALMVRKTLPILALLVCGTLHGQPTTVVEGPAGKPPRARVIPGEKYRAGGFKKIFMGRHYRQEWTTPVWVPVLRMDTLGGLSVVEAGGGKQTFSLRLRDGQGRLWALRSIDKDNSTVLPKMLRGTFIDRAAQDMVSCSHPYAALTIPLMARAAGVYHASPRILLAPDDPRFGKYRSQVAGRLFMLEERPDDMPSGIENFGYATTFIGTDKLMELLATEPDHRHDQEAYVRARIFDMFIGDWDRHENQWRWARFKEGSETVYRPIPRDRDQVYALFQGVIPYLLTLPEELEVLQSFQGDIKNVKKFNSSARFIDRRLANEVPPERWTAIARELQERLTDAVIEQSVRQLPPEIFAASGETIIRKLKSRRGHLVAYAAQYGAYLAKQVDVPGTKGADRFVVDNDAGGRLRLQVFDADNNAAKKPYYQRSFDPAMTNEVRLYGLAGADVFDIRGDRGDIRVRVIGSPDRDSVLVVGSGKKVVVYDNPGDVLQGDGHVKWQRSSDTAINRYEYKGFRANSGHTIKFPGYSNLRGVYLNLGYIYRKRSFRKEPFSWEQRLRANYSISRRSFGGDYRGIFHEVVGKWSLLLDGRYDQVLKHFYFGGGNETKIAPGVSDLNFYRLLTEEGAGSIRLERVMGKHHRLGFGGGYDMVRVLGDSGHFSGKELPRTAANTYDRQHFGSAKVYYNFRAVNNEVLPTKGFNLQLLARHTQNLHQSDRSIQRYEGTATGYFPFSRVISLVIHGGAASVRGKPEFYQLPTLGGGPSLRGYRRERFRGETVAFNQNELRFLWDFRSWLFNGKAGLVGFFDQGRAWQPGEEYKTWHTGFGAGIMVAPFNMMALTIAYGVSPEDRVLNLRLGAKVF